MLEAERSRTLQFRGLPIRYHRPPRRTPQGSLFTRPVHGNGPVDLDPGEPGKGASKLAFSRRKDAPAMRGGSGRKDLS